MENHPGGIVPYTIQELTRLKPRLSNRGFEKLLVANFRKETAKRWENTWYYIRMSAIFMFGIVIALLAVRGS